jgi:hypothetical protein
MKSITATYNPDLIRKFNVMYSTRYHKQNPKIYIRILYILDVYSTKIYSLQYHYTEFVLINSEQISTFFLFFFSLIKIKIIIKTIFFEKSNKRYCYYYIHRMIYGNSLGLFLIIKSLPHYITILLAKFYQILL